MPNAFTTEMFINKAITLHGNKYDYTYVNYENRDTGVLIKCNRCHESFQKTPRLHLRGSGCYNCDKTTGVFRTGRQKKSQTKFLEEALKMHGNKYDYSKTLYTGALEKVVITCRLHGDFEQPADNHIRGAGCHKCAQYLSSSEKLISQDEFVTRAKEVWISKYNYFKSNYTGMRNNITVTCPLHGDFITKARVHLAGHTSCSGCQHRGYSEKAMNWLRTVSEQENIHIQHAENGGEFLVPGTAYHADGFCDKTNTIYEYFGSFWHGDPAVYADSYWNTMTNCTMGDLYQKTLKKLARYKELGYNVRQRWESEDRNLKFHSAIEECMEAISTIDII